MIDSKTRELYKELKKAFTLTKSEIVLMYGTKTDACTHAFEFSISGGEYTSRRIVLLLEFVEDVISEFVTFKISVKYEDALSRLLKDSKFKTTRVHFDKKNRTVVFNFGDIIPTALKIRSALRECFAIESLCGSFRFAEEEQLISDLDVATANRNLIELVSQFDSEAVTEIKPKRKRRVIYESPFSDEGLMGVPEEPSGFAEVPKSLRPIALEIGEEIKKYVYGQDDYIERLALLVQEQLTIGRAKPLLVIGKSGSGKTYTIQMLMEHCKKVLPSDYEFIYADCSGLTEKGFTGAEVSSIFNNIKAKRGIIFLDEIDKIIRVSSNSKGENVNLAVQTELMNYVSGKVISKLGKTIDTSNFLFVLGGAFPELYELHNQKRHSFGFVPGEYSLITDDTHNEEVDAAKCEIRMLSGNKSLTKGVVSLTFKDTTKEAVTIRNDLVTIGASREFMGRIGAIVTLRQLTADDFRKILLDSVIPEKKESIKKCYNIVFEFSDRAINSIIDSAMENEYGARIIKTTVDNLVDSVIYPTITEVNNLDGNSSKRVTPISLDIDFENDRFNYCVSLMNA